MFAITFAFYKSQGLGTLRMREYWLLQVLACPSLETVVSLGEIQTWSPTNLGMLILRLTTISTDVMSEIMLLSAMGVHQSTILWSLICKFPSVLHQSASLCPA